ncbi:MAG: hypothetical protein RAO94_07310 [Candidatus Stygibacter australis]|nr:hypothetical protein [Candidatus Stygibacter australis]MDP8322140.1 hypothetical protein [Candidatus Stygibacter australis]
MLFKKRKKKVAKQKISKEEKKTIMSIGEKVKFWEQQDKINNELIPRVLKNHEMISKLTTQFSNLSSSEISRKKIILRNLTKNYLSYIAIIISIVSLILTYIFR